MSARECRVEVDGEGWITTVIYREGIAGDLAGTIVSEEQGRELTHLLGVARLQDGVVEVPAAAVIRQRWRARGMPAASVDALLAATAAARQLRQVGAP